MKKGHMENSMADNALPSFDDAVERLYMMLAPRVDGFFRPDLLWLTREDFYEVRPGWVYYSPRPSCTAAMFRQYYEVGRARGMVALNALFHARGNLACTIWFPSTPHDAMQGWNGGLRISIAMPLGIGNAVRTDLRWKLHTCMPQYRRFTAFNTRVPTAASINAAVSG
jgi:hypothetical protein